MSKRYVQKDIEVKPGLAGIIQVSIIFSYSFWLVLFMFVAASQSKTWYDIILNVFSVFFIGLLCVCVWVILDALG